MAEDSKEYTAFTVPNRGLFQFRRMPFGLTNSPATWNRLIDTVLGADLEPYVFVYLDDIIVISTPRECLLKAGLTLSKDKCLFCRPELQYLRYVVDKQGLLVDPGKVNSILNIPTPASVADVRSFLGMASWYRRFFKDFSTISAPLSDLLRKDRSLKWTEQCEAAFIHLKECSVLQTDASGEYVICFLSRSLNKAERNYSTTERECFAVVWALEKLRPYLEGSHFMVITDHHSLVWLNNLKDPTGRLCRWPVKLQQRDFEIFHRKGKDHVVPDC